MCFLSYLIILYELDCGLPHLTTLYARANIVYGSSTHQLMEQFRMKKRKVNYEQLETIIYEMLFMVIYGYIYSGLHIFLYAFNGINPSPNKMFGKIT